MSSDLMVHELFRTLENTIHERLNMIEDVIRLTRSKPLESGQDDEMATSAAYLDRIRTLETELATMSSRLAALEMADADARSQAEEVPIVHVNHVGSQGETLAPAEPVPVAASASTPEIKGDIWIEPMKGLEINLAENIVAPVAAPVPAVIIAQPVEAKEVVQTPEVVEEEEDVEMQEEEEEVEVEVEEEAAEEEEAVEETEEGEEEAQEEEEEEAALELEAFEYKGKTYYKDQENQVYASNPDDPEDVIETPVGVWNEERQRILFKRV